MQFEMNDKTYKIMCWIARIVLPALGALYFGLARIWNLPYGEEVVGTITCIVTFLSVVLGISEAKYDAKKNAD